MRDEDIAGSIIPCGAGLTFVGLWMEFGIGPALFVLGLSLIGFGIFGFTRRKKNAGD